MDESEVFEMPKPVSKTQHNNTCKGVCKNKKQCTHRGKYNGYCKRHHPNPDTLSEITTIKTQSSLSVEDICTCQILNMSGKNKGKPCGRRASYETSTGIMCCGRHRKSIQKPGDIEDNESRESTPTNTNGKKSTILSIKETDSCTKEIKNGDRSISKNKKSYLSECHQKYKTMTSKNLHSFFKEDNDKFIEYHKTVQINESTFDPKDIPRNEIKTHLIERNPDIPTSVIDMGCGYGDLVKEVNEYYTNNESQNNYTFYSYDHVSVDPRYVKCRDISSLPHGDNSIDICVLCLAMWGSNCEDYIKEAYRVLKKGGILYISEANKRWITEDGESNRLFDIIVLNKFNIIKQIGFRSKFIRYTCKKCKE